MANIESTPPQRDAITPVPSTPHIEGGPAGENPQYGKQLVNYAKYSIVEEHGPMFGQFSTLQGVNLANLQNKLAVVKREVSETDGISQSQIEALPHIMHSYSKTPYRLNLSTRR